MAAAIELEQIEVLKAKDRMLNGKAADPGKNFPEATGRVRDIVAKRVDIGYGRQYEKEKFIVSHRNMNL